MYGKYLSKAVHLFIASLLITSCQSSNLSEIKKVQSSLFATGKKVLSASNFSSKNATVNNSLALAEILDGSLEIKNGGSDFISAVSFALSADPVILSKQRDIEAKLAVVSSNKAQKDFQVGTTIYGGIEDITENTKGVALSLNASRLVFDGGKTDAQIESALFLLRLQRWI